MARGSGPNPFYVLQPAFTAGEISNAVANRVDLDKYQYALLTAENCYIRPYGPVYRRSGTVYCIATKYADKRCILAGFNFTDDINYLLEIGDQYIRIHRNGNYLGIEIVTPFTEADLEKLRFAQSADVIYITSGNYPVKQLARYSEDDWKFGDFEITHAYFEDEATMELVESAVYMAPGNYTYTVPKDGRYTIEVAGGGGGGSGVARKASDKQSSGGTGGRGGFYSFEMDLTEGDSFPVTVGAGGKGGAVHYGAGYGNAGGNGGSSSAFGWVAQGGGGATAAYSEEHGAKNGSDGTNYGNGGIGGKKGVAYDENNLSGTDGSNGWVTIAFQDNPKVTPSSTTGTVTITSNRPIFNEGLIDGNIRLTHEVESFSVELNLKDNATGTTGAVVVGESWKVISGGSWTGSFQIQKSEDGTTWKEYRKYSSTNNFNPTESGTVTDTTYLRIEASITSGDLTVTLTALPYTKDGTAKIISYIDEYNIKAMVNEPFGSTESTTTYAFGAWDSNFGYPKTVCFFQDRLCFGGNNKRPYTVWMSKSGDYPNFGVEKVSGTITDDSAIAASFISRKQFDILHLIPSVDLLVLTQGNEWIVSGSEVVTPTNITPKMQTTRGCSNCEPLTIGNRIVFVQGRGSTVRDMGYSFETDSYGGMELTILAGQIIKGLSIIDSAYKQEPDSIIYFVRSDGTIACLSYIREQEVYAWSRIITDGEFEAVVNIPEGDEDSIYAVVKRVVNGETVRYIERFDNNYDGDSPNDYVMLDCAKKYDMEEATDTLTGLGHLAGNTISVVGDGRVLRNYTVQDDGTVKLPIQIKRAVAGLPYTMNIELPNIEVQLQDGTMQGRFKQVSEAILRVENTFGGEVGTEFGNQDAIAYDEFSMTENMKLYSGDKKATPPTGGFDRDGRLCITSSEPYPFNLLSVTRQVTFGG